ncbi:MAG TPA: L,D-transpeptidase family protein [Candidatus Saccharimonadales bacterium]|nr:L,D-transpeptidase family protein [Candidatus Saccharimonadales bacterium]
MVVSINHLINTAKKSAKKTEKVLSKRLQSLRQTLIIATVGVVALLTTWSIGNITYLSYQVGNLHIRTTSSRSSEIRLLDQIAASYRLRIQYPGNKIKTFPASAAGLVLNDTASLQALKHSSSIKHLLEWWQPISAAMIWKINHSQFNSFVAQNATMIISQPTNANVTISNGTVSLTSAKVGSEYGLKNAQHVIMYRAKLLSTEPLTLTKTALSPAITDGQLASATQKINQIIKEQLSISVGGQVVTPSPADIASWLSLTPNVVAKTVNVAVNGVTLNNYLAELASQSYQAGHDQVSIVLADGTTSVAVNGKDGVVITGQQTAATTISQQLLDGKNFAVTMPAVTTAFNTVTAGNWPQWIEVNLTTKRLYAYQSGNIVNSFLATAGKPSTPTPTGTFYIWDKVISQTMAGPGYIQPDVPWINYFDKSGDAIHGNYWRPTSVFGNVNTSHGCVGLEVGDAEWVYDWAPIGTPVVIHY